MNRYIVVFIALLLCCQYMASGQATVCPPNVDFETGTYSGWYFFNGVVYTGPIYNLNEGPPVIPSKELVTSGTDVDKYGGFPIVAPGGGTYSLRLGSDSNGTCAEMAVYYIDIPPGSTVYSLVYHYAAVLENPGHPWGEQPGFAVSAVDSATGVPIPCSVYTYVSGGGVPGFFLSPVISKYVGNGYDVTYKPWTFGNIKFPGENGQTVAVQFLANDCTLGGHFGYGYLDLSCGLFANVISCGTTTETLTAPAGFSAYQWLDSATMSVSYGTTQAITVATPLAPFTYVVVVTPYAGYGCIDTLYSRLIPSNLLINPGDDTTICARDTITLNAGATDIDTPLSYIWIPSIGLSCATCASPQAYPDSTTAYTVTVTDPGGCFLTHVFTVTVRPSPTPISGNLNLCTGDTATLSGGLGGGVWSSSNIAAATISTSGGVTGLGAGASAISYVLSDGCFSAAVFTVNAVPDVITGVTNVCAGLQTALSETTTGGVWSSSNTTVATVDAFGTVTGVTSGAPVITYQLSTGCNSIAPVTVNPLPQIITGIDSVCVGSAIALHDVTSAGTWTSGSPSVASVGTTGFVFGLLPGTSVINYTLGTGCMRAVAVTVNASPDTITGVTEICQGATTTLNVTTGGGTWSSASTAAATVNGSGIVFGQYPGASLITYQLATGCPSLATVTVNPLPLAITGPAALCAGAGVSLHDGTIDGTWSSSVLSAASAGPTGFVNGIMPGTSVISYTLGTGCMRSLAITVNPLPEPITGATNACLATVTTLEDATTGGTWSSANAAIATVSSAMGWVTGIVPGTTTISYTITGTGCAVTAEITVNTLPAAITGTLPAAGLCIGATATLADATSGGIWSSSNTAITMVSAGGGAVSGVAAGTVLVTYTLSTGCIATRAVSVSPYHVPAAISGISAVCPTARAGLTDATTGGMWSSSNPAVATIGTAGAVSGIMPGTSTINYTLGTGCTAAKIITVDPDPAVFTVTGGGSYCEGAGGVPVGLSGSATGVNYQLFYGVTLVGGPLAGTGGALSFGSQTLEEVYTVVATNVATGCSVTMADSAPVITNVLPAVHSVTGGGHYCIGGTGVHIGLDGSGSGINYELYRAGASVALLAGSGIAIDFGLITVAGTYRVIAVNATTGCTDTMADSVAVTVDPLVTASVSIATGIGDTVCSGTPLTITAMPVNGGAAPAYVWRVNGLAAPVTGGAYSYVPSDGDRVAVTLASSIPCAVPDSVSSALTLRVLLSGLPAVDISATPGDSVCDGATTYFTAAISRGGTAPVLSWVMDGAIAGSGLTYSYTPANMDIIYCVLGSNDQCRTADSGTSNIITMTVADSSTPVVTVTATPGLDITHGQSVTLTAAVIRSGAAPTYQWYINGLPVAGADSATFTDGNLTNGDSVSCEVTGNSICNNPGYGWAVFEVNDGIPVLSGTDKLTLLPNPTTGEFTIRGSLGMADDEDISLVITDLLGQSIYKNTINAPGGKINFRASLSSSLANGVYILTLRSGSVIGILRVVVAR